MLLHDGEMNRIAGGEPPIAQDNLLRAFQDHGVDGQDLVRDSQEHVEGGLDVKVPIECRIAVEDLVQHLGVGYESLALSN